MTRQVHAGMVFGERVRVFRDRAGMSRPVLGGLVGRSAEWVKAIETGRLLPPRLPMLLRLAQVLRVPELADLTGQQQVSSAAYAKSAHESLPTVARALVSYPLGAGDGEPLTA
ncbi:MAG TPA: helix-turn-helix transcriptional regulator, partial [Cryptosporangiaceae bacterium]|nr:helix-turn-helix transcriptional regulator [Cryptosporangiaceae bacterium]